MHALPKEVAPLIRDRMFYTKLIIQVVMSHLTN